MRKNIKTTEAIFPMPVLMVATYNEDGSVEVAKNRKVSKWIRYPIVVLISVFIIAIIGLLAFVGFALIFEGERYAKLGGILFLIFDIILIISAIKNIKKEIEMKKSK